MNGKGYIQRASSILRCLLGISFGLLIVALFFPQKLPLGTPSQELLAFSPPPLLDMHVHVAGFGYGGSGCFIHPRLSGSFKRHFYLRAFGVSESELQREGDALLVTRLSERIAQSQFVDQAVILAMDGVIDEQGAVDRKKTEVFIPNSYIKQQTDRFENLLYGASVNPYRKDSLERLRQAKQDGALLIKWIPSIMHIDPADPALDAFYQELVRLKLPLLTHTGQERSFTYSIDELNDPQRLHRPLTLGVTVIAAHIATTGSVDEQEMIDRLLPLFDQYPNLYGDVSSLTQINKLGYIEQGMLNEKLSGRLLYGSDWPLQFFPLVSPWYHFQHASLADLQYVAGQKNVFDRDVLLKRALGIDESIFLRSRTLLFPTGSSRFNQLAVTKAPS